MARSLVVEDKATDRAPAANMAERSATEETVAALKVANQELRAFSDAVAHDLRSSLLVVTNFSHQLFEALGDTLEQQHREDLERIAFAGRHMMHIIDDLRDLTDVNRAEITRVDIDLSVMGREIIDDLRAVVPDRDVRFDAEPGIIAIGDRGLVSLLLTNLLQNSWKYTGRQVDAWIELGVAEEDGVRVFSVRDNGIGFDNAEREKIFEPFARLHSRADFTGSGLGLATVARIIGRHGGRVWADGVPGEGAVFRFTLGS